MCVTHKGTSFLNRFQFFSPYFHNNLIAYIKWEGERERNWMWETWSNFLSLLLHHSSHTHVLSFFLFHLKIFFLNPFQLLFPFCWFHFSKFPLTQLSFKCSHLCRRRIAIAEFCVFCSACLFHHIQSSAFSLTLTLPIITPFILCNE